MTGREKVMTGIRIGLITAVVGGAGAAYQVAENEKPHITNNATAEANRLIKDPQAPQPSAEYASLAHQLNELGLQRDAILHQGIASNLGPDTAQIARVIQGDKDYSSQRAASLQEEIDQIKTSPSYAAEAQPGRDFDNLVASNANRRQEMVASLEKKHHKSVWNNVQGAAIIIGGMIFVWGGFVELLHHNDLPDSIPGNPAWPLRKRRPSPAGK